MSRKKSGKRKRRRRGLHGFLIVLLLLAVSALVAVKVFTVEKVEVSGNEHYGDELIREWVLNDKYCWNTLYVYLKYRFQEPEDIPFVDTMEISMELPHTIRIRVYEKGVIGYVHLETLGQNAYIDKDGFVVETSSEVVDGVPRISGLSVDSVVLYEKLSIKENGVMKNLLPLTRALKKYEIEPDSIVCEEDKTFSLEYGEVRVLLGGSGDFSGKIARISYIMPSLEGKKGILHMENWTENTKDLYFQEE